MVVLSTDRLELRRLEPDDLAPLYALYRDPEIRRYFGAACCRGTSRARTKLSSPS